MDKPGGKDGMKILRNRIWQGAALALLASGLFAISSMSNEVKPPDFLDLDPTPMSREIAPRSWRAQQALIRIPAGTYTLGRENGPADERPAHQISLDAFRIDRTEVTNAAFAEFLNALPLQPAGSFDTAEISRNAMPQRSYDVLHEGMEGSGEYPIIALDDAQVRIRLVDGVFEPTPGYEDHPVAETSWAGARAYCHWRGARLPSEAEWEAAARGTDGRLYPWGNEPPTPERAFVSRRTAVTAEVGGRPDGASPFGVLDMSGSMAEWTSSLKRPYPYQSNDGRENPDVAGERVTRGGDYRYDTGADQLTATHRSGFSNAPNRGHRHIGFRCAADLS